MKVIPHPATVQRAEAPRLLENMRRAIRVHHYSIRTEEAYLGWVNRFFRVHRRHPKELAADLNRFLTHLAVHGRVAPSTQRQALSAILFLYRNVLKMDPPWIEDIVRARQPKRLPTVLSKEEVVALLTRLEGTTQLIVMLLYGTGMRILECLRLRVQDVDFSLGAITIRDGKGRKDRVALLRHTPPDGRLRHSNHPGTPGPQGCQNDHDLHPCPQPVRRQRCRQPGRRSRHRRPRTSLSNRPPFV